MSEPDFEFSATYQGFVCESATFKTAQGAAPGTGEIIMPFTSFVSLIAGDAWADVGVGSSSSGARQFAGGPIEIRGDLVMRRAGRERVFRDLYIDGPIKSIVRSDQRDVDRGFMQFRVMDVRGLWASRGTVYGEYNTPVDVNGLGGFPGLVPALAPSGTTPALRASSLRPDFRPYSLLDLAQRCLEALPGRPKLVGTDAATAYMEKQVPIRIDWRDFPFAVRALEALLGAYDLRLAFDPDAQTLAVWLFGDGAPVFTHSGAALTSIGLPGASESAIPDVKSISSWETTAQHFLKPPAVRVVGRPIVREAMFALEPVGEVLGQIMPLEIAASYHRMTMPELRRWVVLPSEEQVAWQGGRLSGNSIQELRRWAFRWFRIPVARAGVLPLLPHRANTGIDGPKRPAVVIADIFDEIRFSDLQRVEKEQIAEIPERMKELAATFAPWDAVKQALAKALAAGGAGASFRESVLEALNSPTPTPPPPEPKAGTGVLDELRAWLNPGVKDHKTQPPHVTTIAEDLGKETTQRLIAAAILLDEQARERSLNLASSEYGHAILFNIPNAQLSSADYDETITDGVVKFHRLIGSVEITSTLVNATSALFFPKLAESRLKDGPINVRLLAAFESTPDARVAVSLPDGADYAAVLRAQLAGTAIDKAGDAINRYSFLGKLGGDGKVEQLNPTGVEPQSGAARLFPRTVKTNFRCYVDIDGNTNRAALDAAASAIVARELAGEQQILGLDGTAEDLYPIQTTGVIAEVSWEVTTKGAKTSWKTGVLRDVEARNRWKIDPPGSHGPSGPGATS